AASRAAGADEVRAVTLHTPGRSELQLGRTSAGVDALRESLAIGRRLGYREVIAYLLRGFAEVAMIEDAAPRAAVLLGASEQLFTEIGCVPDPDEAQTQARLSAFVVDTLGEGRAAGLRGGGGAEKPQDPDH